MNGRSRVRALAALTLVPLLSIGLASCGDDDDETAAEDSSSTTEAEEAAADTAQVEYLDYSFRVSGPLVAGGTIELSNTGKELHMMGIGLLDDGKTIDDVVAALSEEGGGDEEDPFAGILTELGAPGNIMSPGQSASVTVPDLTAGNYALICFLPAEGTGRPHFSLGMVNELEVVEGTTPDEPTADATYKIAPGQAPDGPATLEAGERTLKFEAVGDEAGELEPGIGKLDPGKNFQDFDAAINALFENEPPKGAAEQLPGDLVFAGHDFEDVTSFYLTIDFEPGDYLLVAEDTDVENPPRPPKELLTITVS